MNRLEGVWGCFGGYFRLSIRGWDYVFGLGPRTIEILWVSVGFGCPSKFRISSSMNPNNVLPDSGHGSAARNVIVSSYNRQQPPEPMDQHEVYKWRKLRKQRKMTETHQSSAPCSGLLGSSCPKKIGLN